MAVVAEKLLCYTTRAISTLCASIVAINIVYTGGWHSWEEFAELSHTCNDAFWVESKTTAVQSLVGCLSGCGSDYCSYHR